MTAIRMDFPRHVKWTLLLIISVAAVLGCATLIPTEDGSDRDQSNHTTSTGDLSDVNIKNYPHIDGSTSTLPLDTLIACWWFETQCVWIDWMDGPKMMVPELADSEDSFPEIIHHGTHDAYVNLITGAADLILVARLPSADEQNLAAVQDVNLNPKPIALDAFVFVLNADNSVDNLATPQIQGIYTGLLTNWSQVGGVEADIHPYQRNPNSGSQELMISLVMKDLALINAPEMTLEGMMGPINRISEDVDGIGYSVYFFEEFMAPNEALKLSSVDGIEPTSETIRNRSYPYTTEVFAVVRSDLDHGSTAFQMYEWLGSEAGQRIIAESGYVPNR
jgi:phosphate transport system substrate-binding protein